MVREFIYEVNSVIFQTIFILWLPCSYFRDFPMICPNPTNRLKIYTEALKTVIKGSLSMVLWSNISFMKSIQPYFKSLSSYSTLYSLHDLHFILTSKWKPRNRHKIWPYRADMSVTYKSLPRFQWSGVLFMKLIPSNCKPISLYKPPLSTRGMALKS